MLTVAKYSGGGSHLPDQHSNVLWARTRPFFAARATSAESIIISPCH